MHTETIEHWAHDHVFGQDIPKPGERRTLIVIVITCVMMAAEVAAGLVFRSMALLADGLHMASHASALAISAFAYYYTRRHARDTRFIFGTGKVNSLAGFTSAVILVGFALVMAWNSCGRILSPVKIEFNPAILVAILGLAVNGICLFVLRGHVRDHPDEEHDNHASCGHAHADHNLWSAYMHVLADAATSVLAIFALLTGKRLGLVWLDPLMGVAGAGLVIRWSWGLIRSSSRVLLDMRLPEPIMHGIREIIEKDSDTRVADLHVWAVGPGILAAEIAVVTSTPKEPGHYCDLVGRSMGLAHVTVEVHRCPTATEKC
ncbi:MAG: CDF family Co(II)/Ni(II) efflux transporter DmeF [Elusimicrobia bacterium]|nr:CDF family Co(II)/Ni(II) efflux transporter DmeF [Elusimicrobiota bacterium]